MGIFITCLCFYWLNQCATRVVETYIYLVVSYQLAIISKTLVPFWVSFVRNMCRNFLWNESVHLCFISPFNLTCSLQFCVVFFCLCMFLHYSSGTTMSSGSWVWKQGYELKNRVILHVDMIGTCKYVLVIDN